MTRLQFILLMLSPLLSVFGKKPEVTAQDARQMLKDTWGEPLYFRGVEMLHYDVRDPQVGDRRYHPQDKSMYLEYDGAAWVYKADHDRPKMKKIEFPLEYKDA